MGTYIYTLRKTRPVKTLRGPVYCYRFSGRSSHLYNAKSDAYQRKLDRCNEAFAKVENCLVAMDYEGGDMEGQVVYKQEKGVGVYFDYDDVPGKPFGVLAKTGKSWEVQSVRYYMLRLDCKLLDYCSENFISFEPKDCLADVIVETFKNEKGNIDCTKLTKQQNDALEICELFFSLRKHLPKKKEGGWVLTSLVG
jgi:hypothetical protein